MFLPFLLLPLLSHLTSSSILSSFPYSYLPHLHLNSFLLPLLLPSSPPPQFFPSSLTPTFLTSTSILSFFLYSYLPHLRLNSFLLQLLLSSSPPPQFFPPSLTPIFLTSSSILSSFPYSYLPLVPSIISSFSYSYLPHLHLNSFLLPLLLSSSPLLPSILSSPSLTPIFLTSSILSSFPYSYLPHLLLNSFLLLHSFLLSLTSSFIPSFFFFYFPLSSPILIDHLNSSLGNQTHSVSVSLTLEPSESVGHKPEITLPNMKQMTFPSSISQEEIMAAVCSGVQMATLRGMYLTKRIYHVLIVCMSSH